MPFFDKFQKPDVQKLERQLYDLDVEVQIKAVLGLEKLEGSEVAKILLAALNKSMQRRKGFGQAICTIRQGLAAG